MGPCHHGMALLPGLVEETASNIELKRVQVCTNLSSINRGLMKNAWIFGSKEQTKMQWLQDPNQSNVENIINARREASRHFRNKKRNI